MTTKDSETPNPRVDLISLSNTLVRVDQNVKSIKNDLLPPVAADAREARDKARAALGKIDEHTSESGAHFHSCGESVRQEKQDTAIADMRPKIAGLDKWRWWLMGALALGLSSAIGFSMLTSGENARHATQLGAHEREIERHEREIDSLEKSQQADRETYLREVRNLPQKVEQVVKQDPVTPETIESVVVDLPLSPSERRQLNEILAKARARENGDGG